MAKKKEAPRSRARRKLREEQQMTVQDSEGRNHTAYYGIADGSDVVVHLSNGWEIFTTGEVRARTPDNTLLIAADRPIPKERVAQCRQQWGVDHYPVVVFPKNTPASCAEAFRGRAAQTHTQETSQQEESARQIAPKLRDSLNELVELYRLYIQIEGKIEGNESFMDAALKRGIDKEVATKLMGCREHAPYLCEVFKTIVHERFNGQFNVVDAYRGISAPSQQQARFAIDFAIEVSEIAYQCNRIIAQEGLTRQHPGLVEFTVDVVADLCVAALFSHNACWGEEGAVEDHEAKSAANYVVMRQHVPHLPPVEDLIENHSSVWPYDWVYAIHVEAAGMVAGATHKTERTSYRLGSGWDQNTKLETAIAAGLERTIDLQGLGISHNVQSWCADPCIVLYINILAIAERIVEAVQARANLAGLFADLAARIPKPQDPDYAIETHMRTGLPLYSRVVAAATAKRNTIPRGAIVLFANGTGEMRSEPARHVAVDGGIAISLGGDPVELLLVSHDNIRGLLQAPKSAQTLAQATMGANGYPMMHFISFAHGPHRQIFQNRGTVVGIVDRESLERFLAPRMHMIDQARAHLMPS
ncbi:MAG: hypothetical protein Q8P78_02945 [bacterium]|nr:hypothetical protein [bacterium]